MTASTPPLVDVIAGAVVKALELDIDDEREDQAFWYNTAPAEWPAVIARAVLDALEQAGGVEWGWEYQSIIGGDYNKRITRNWGGERPLTREEAEAHVAAMNKNTRRPGVARLITRLTGPWMPAP